MLKRAEIRVLLQPWSAEMALVEAGAKIELESGVGAAQVYYTSSDVSAMWVAAE